MARGAAVRRGSELPIVTSRGGSGRASPLNARMAHPDDGRGGEGGEPLSLQLSNLGLRPRLRAAPTCGAPEATGVGVVRHGVGILLESAQRVYVTEWDLSSGSSHRIPSGPRAPPVCSVGYTL